MLQVKLLLAGITLGITGITNAALNPGDLPHNRNNPIGWVNPPLTIGPLPWSGITNPPPSAWRPLPGQTAPRDTDQWFDRGGVIRGQPSIESPPVDLTPWLPPNYQPAIPSWFLHGYPTNR